VIGKVILGLGSVAGGTLAAWRLTQEVVESRKLGPPAWWVLWMHPVTREVEPPSAKRTEEHATRVYRWEKDSWVPLTPHLYLHASAATLVVGGPPIGRLLYAQVRWKRKLGGTWSVSHVEYARNVKDKLPR
jgi:hypothetical protein